MNARAGLVTQRHMAAETRSHQVGDGRYRLAILLPPPGRALLQHRQPSVGRFREPGRRERTVLPDHVPPTRRALRRPTRYLIRYVLAPEGLTRTPSAAKSVTCAIWRAVAPFIASTACLVIWTLSDFCWARSFRPFGHDGVAGLLFDRRKPAISTAPLPSRRTAGGAGIGAGDWTDRAEMP